jgi:S1-C subfamily serine protease
MMIAALIVLIPFLAVPPFSDAQSLARHFASAKPSVVVLHAEEQNLAESHEKGETVTESGLGSGVLISADGDILTAAHVVQTADKVTVTFSDGTESDARVVASHADVDVALVKADNVPPGAIVASVANSDSVLIGDNIFIIGAPYGLAHTLTSGLISARHKPKKYYSEFVEAELFQTDAAINSGNSGGPMFNLKGEVIGIVSHILTKSGGFEGLGFAVTSNLAMQLLYQRGSFWSGMEVMRISDETAAVLNVPQPAAYLVTKVATGSPADKIGIKGGFLKSEIEGESIILGGDIILSILDVSTSDDDARARIRRSIGELKPGDSLTMTVWRRGVLEELVLQWE